MSRFGVRNLKIQVETVDIIVQWKDGSASKPCIVGLLDLDANKILGHRVVRDRDEAAIAAARADLLKTAF